MKIQIENFLNIKVSSYIYLNKNNGFEHMI